MRPVRATCGLTRRCGQTLVDHFYLELLRHQRAHHWHLHQLSRQLLRLPRPLNQLAQLPIHRIPENMEHHLSLPWTPRGKTGAIMRSSRNRLCTKCFSKSSLTKTNVRNCGSTKSTSKATLDSENLSSISISWPGTMPMPDTLQTTGELSSTSQHSISKTPHHYGHRHYNLHPTAPDLPLTTPTSTPTSSTPNIATLAAQHQERLFAPPTPGANPTTIICNLTVTPDQLQGLAVGLQALASSIPSEQTEPPATGAPGRI